MSVLEGGAESSRRSLATSAVLNFAIRKQLLRKCACVLVLVGVGVGESLLYLFLYRFLV